MDNQNNVLQEKQAWLGAVIKNTGTGTAKNVEVFFEGIKSNVITQIDNYKSLPLVRSWIRDQKISSIPPGLSFRFDICYMRSVTPNKMHFAFMKTPTAFADIVCNQNDGATFEFHLKAVSENSPLVSKSVCLSSKGTYKSDFVIT